MQHQLIPSLVTIGNWDPFHLVHWTSFQYLLRHLDRMLSQFNLGVEHLWLCEPNLSEDDVGQMKYEYGELREVLLQVDADVEAGLIVSTLNQLSFPNH